MPENAEAGGLKLGREAAKEYLACRLCDFDVVIIRREDFRNHIEQVHKAHREGDVSEFSDGSLVERCCGDETMAQLRDGLSVEKLNEFYYESGRDLSIFEATETLKVAIQLFLTEFKRKIVALNFPSVRVKDFENEQLNKFLIASQGAFYFYSLIDLCRVEDITVQMLLARSWDWCLEDQDLRKELDAIKRCIIPKKDHPSHLEALESIETGKMLLLTMHESVKHLLLLCYLTKKVIKRQE
ncbi:hypothetical protein HWI79_504 [Cryptosporidium felis]|nr:hypothetical protein HWI79_504 [Cryptosporidium felis]